MKKLLLAILLLLSGNSLADNIKTNVTITNAPFNGGAVAGVITANGGIIINGLSSNTYVPVAFNGNGTIFDSESSYAFNTGDNRPYFYQSTITWNGISPATAINEEMFVSGKYIWNGPFTASQEQNSIHGYMENDIGTGCIPVSTCTQSGFQEVFEASGLNYIAASTWSDYLGIFHNMSGATLGNYWGYKCGFTNDGVINRAACFEMDAVSGTAPVTYYSILLNDAAAVFASLGPVSIGTVTAVTNRQLFVKGIDNSSGTIMIEAQRADGTVVYRLSDTGDGTFAGNTSVTGQLSSTAGLRNTSIGVTNPSTAAFTTLAASGLSTLATLKLTSLPTACTAQPTNTVASVAGVLTLCP